MKRLIAVLTVSLLILSGCGTSQMASGDPGAIFAGAAIGGNVGGDNLRIRNIRFIDDDRDHIITSGESSKVIFEIMNEGNQTIYNVVPMVTEITGMKRIYISPPVMVEQIAPRNGVKYTANISAGDRIKTGDITIRVAVADGNGQQYDWQEFSLSTRR